jgi:hypothetical protein
MAKNKIDVLSIGRGGLQDSTNAIHSFSANNMVALWSGANTYAQYNVVEYSGKVYRSKVAANIGNQPDISPNQWETLYSDVKDGDVAFVYSGSTSTTLQRANGLWASINGVPVAVTLVDGQLVPAVAFSYPASFRRAEITFSITRGADARIKEGKWTVLNNGAGNVEYSEEFTLMGADVNVVDQGFAASGPNIEWSYTSALEGVSVTLHWQMKGW